MCTFSHDRMIPLIAFMRLAIFFSKDIHSGGWQIEVDELDHKKTALITSNDLYQSKVMVCSFCNTPASSERMKDSLHRGFIWPTYLRHLDNFSPTFETRIECLSAVLDIFRCTDLQLNLSKHHFDHHQILVLGYLVDTVDNQTRQKSAQSETSVCHNLGRMYAALLNHAHTSTAS